MSRKTHKPQPRHTYTLLDVMCASPTEPMPKEKREYQVGRMLRGLDAIERGGKPTTDDWRLCSDCVNLMETFALAGWFTGCDGEAVKVSDSAGLVMDGITALALAGRRAVMGGAIRLDGPGIAAMRAIIADYASLLESIPARAVIECHRRTERRIREILDGKSAAHDVEIITAAMA